MNNKKKITDPVDPKGAYDSSLEIVSALLKKEISIPRAEAISNLLTNSNRTFGLYLKYAQITKDPEATMNQFLEKKNNG